MATAIVGSACPVVGGVDTHLDQHVAAVVDQVGGLLGVERFEVAPGGYRQLVAWMRGFGPVERVKVEGTGPVGARYASGLRRRNRASKYGARLRVAALVHTQIVGRLDEASAGLEHRAIGWRANPCKPGTAA